MMYTYCTCSCDTVHTSRGGGFVYEWSNLNCIAIFMSSRSIDFLFACAEHNFASSNTSVKYPTTVEAEKENRHAHFSIQIRLYRVIFSLYVLKYIAHVSHFQSITD